MKILNIKPIIFKSLLLSLVVLTTSCSEDFLDLSPVSSQNVESFFTNQEDVENAMTGAYSSFYLDGIYGTALPILGELRSDNAEMGSTAGSRADYWSLAEFSTQPSFSLYDDTWDDHYVGISRVNLILSRIDGISDLEDSYVEQIKGECYFLRGLFYFNLVRVFGDVPLVIKELTTIEEAYEYGRTSSDEVYAQIVQDLLYAQDALPATPDDVGRATSGAAAAILGKVYLTMQDYESARDKLAEVINSGTYSLQADYADLWDVANENNSETIFDVQWEGSSTYSTGSYYSEHFFPYGYTNFSFSTTSGGYNIPTEDLIAAYEDDDLRKDITIQMSWMDGDTEITGLEGRYSTKFNDTPETTSSGASDNWHVIRYADVLLMYAEALNEIGYQAGGEAFTYLNAIRSRAGLADKTSGNTDESLSVDSQEEFRLAVEQERRVELAIEGHRWFDLVRTDRAIEVMTSFLGESISEYQLVYPIPQTQIDVNPDKIKQNTGYN